jgi:phage FluMu protein gp41
MDYLASACDGLLKTAQSAAEHVASVSSAAAATTDTVQTGVQTIQKLSASVSEVTKELSKDQLLALDLIKITIDNVINKEKLANEVTTYIISRRTNAWN